MDKEVRGWEAGEDPAADALSPWVWMPMAFLCLCSILFISFRRVQSIAFYEKAKAYTTTHLPFSKPARGIRLSSSANDPERGGDSDSEASFVDDGDELPYSLPPARPSILERSRQGVYSALDTLGWTGNRGGFGGSGDDRNAGIATAFWGIRKKDQTGRIRLGEEGPGAAGSSTSTPKAKRARGPAGFSGLLERVSDFSSSNSIPSPTRSNPQSPRASTSPSLFDVGEEEETDAVELPAEFRLPKKQQGDKASRVLGERLPV